MIVLGADNITKAYIGSTEINKVYLGSNLVWEGESHALPYDAEIEYIEGTGTQWIDTGITTTSGILMEYNGAMGESGKIIVGIWETNRNRLGAYIYNAYNLSVQKISAKYIRVSPQANTFYDVYFDSRGTSFVFKWNGVEKENSTTTETFSSTKTLKVFFQDQTSTVTKGKIRTLKLTDSNGDVVFDAKAVRVGQTGYLYDKVSGKLFGNSGTGSFTLGADV